MTLQEIRQRTGYNPQAPLGLKQATRSWLGSLHQQYPIALTLTLRQVLTEETPAGVRKRSLTRVDAEKLAERFKMKLNRQVFGKRRADVQGMSLNYICVLEGMRSTKNLHLHMAIGGLPKGIKFNQMPKMVLAAKRLVQNIDEQHDLQIADSGWFEYITKETTATDTDNVLWHLS